jgi:hypothetical protein
VRKKKKLSVSIFIDQILTDTPVDRDDVGDVYEGAKEDNIRRVKEGKGKWKEELASNSEAAVKCSFPLTSSDK